MKISQREARRLRKRVAELERREEARNGQWSSEYPGGVNFWNLKADPGTWNAVKVAQLLKHAVVVKTSDDVTLRFYAIVPERG